MKNTLYSEMVRRGHMRGYEPSGDRRQGYALASKQLDAKRYKGRRVNHTSRPPTPSLF